MQNSYLDPPSNFIQRIADFLGVGRLDFQQREEDERRLIYASVLPISLFLVDVTFLILQAAMEIPRGTTNYESAPFRLYTFLATISGPLLVTSIAMLFLFAIYPVNRPQGSFAFLVTMLLLLAGSTLVFVAGVIRVFEQGAASETKWLAGTWQNFGYDFCFLAIGYAFLAYRGLSRQDVGRRVYGQRRRRYPQPDAD